MTCIYCQDRDAESEEHLLPRGLGRFPAPFLPAKGLLCRTCNTRLGNELITPLLQKGFYSQARRRIPWKLGRRPKKNRPQGAGYEMALAEVDGVEGALLVDTDLGGLTGRESRQLIFTETDGSTTPWHVPEHIQTADALAEAIERAGHKGKVMKTFWYGPGDVLPDLLRELYPDAKIGERDPMHEGQVIDAARNYEVTDIHRRAIVMVAFHIFLAIYRSRGHESEFEDVRNFILGDGRSWGPLSANPDSPTESPIGILRDECPARPKHVFGIGKSDAHQVMVCLRLFANEENSTWWRVLLTSDEHRPVQPCIGALVYYEDAPREVEGRVFDGVVVRPARDDDGWVVRCDG